MLFGDLVAVAEHGRNDCWWCCTDEVAECDDAGCFPVYAQIAQLA